MICCSVPPLVLKFVSTKSYIRTDLKEQRRIGFIAQSVESSLGDQLINTNIVGEAKHSFGEGDEK